MIDVKKLSFDDKKKSLSRFAEGVFGVIEPEFFRKSFKCSQDFLIIQLHQIKSTIASIMAPFIFNVSPTPLTTFASFNPIIFS